MTHVLHTEPETYIITDLKGEGVQGTLYGHEVQKVQKPRVFEIEGILKRDGNRVLVKWVGYGPEFNQWLPKYALRQYNMR